MLGFLGFFADLGFAPCGAFELQEMPGGLCQLVPDTIQGLVNALNLAYPFKGPLQKPVLSLF